MAIVITFTLGYFLGGISALVLLGLTVAARRGDHAPVARSHTSIPHEDAGPIWRERP